MHIAKQTRRFNLFQTTLFFCREIQTPFFQKMLSEYLKEMQTQNRSQKEKLFQKNRKLNLWMMKNLKIKQSAQTCRQ